MRARTTSGALGLIAAAGCTIGTGTDQYCDICTLSTDVRGTVLDETELPIVGATVDLKPLYFMECEDAADGNGTVSTVTDEHGMFGAIVGGHSILGPQCVQVHITPPDTGQLLSLVATISARFALPGDVPPVQHVTFVLRFPAG